MDLNLDSLSIDSNGRVTFSGLGSGIDIQGAVDAIIEAKSVPIVTLENRVTANEAKIVALTELRTSLNSLQAAISGLRGVVSFGSTDNSFAAKQAFASTSRSDGQTPSAAGNLLGVTVSNSAAAGSHTVEVRRVAAAHKISSQEFASTSSALSLSGDLTIGTENGSTSITVQSSDTLADIRDRINNANSGTNATGVTASIVSITSTRHILVLTNDNLGESLNVYDSGTVLSGLGISSTNGIQSIANGLSTGSKVEAGDGFAQFNFANNTGDTAFLVSYDSSTKVLTLTRGDGVTDSVTLSSSAIGSGDTEVAKFVQFGTSIVLDENFDKDSDITVAADTSTVTGGNGTITDSTIKISDSTGDISGITSSTLTFGNLASPSAISITVGSFTGSFDGTSTGTKTVSLTDGSNTLEIQFDVATTFDGTESAGSITLNELQNLATSTGSYSDVVQTAQTARLTADGLTDGTHHESSRVADSSAKLSSFLTNATFPGSFDIVGSSTETVNYDSNTTLSDLADLINAETGTTGVTATVAADGDGYRLDLDSSSTFTLTDTNGLLGDLNVNNRLVIERQSNSISDLFSGVTLSLFASEQGTDIKIDIEKDLTTVKSDVQALVDAYNETRRLLNLHSKIDATTGLAAEDAGELFGTPIVTDLKAQLAFAMGGRVEGVSTDFSGFSQIGIDFVNNNALLDELDKDTLEIDDAALDNALLNNIEDVRRLFAFDFTSSDPDVALLGFSSTTQYSASGYTLNVGTYGQLHNLSAAVVDSTATLDDGVNSYGATTSGSFTINGATVNYDVTTDTMDTLIDAINNSMTAAGNGVVASKKLDANNQPVIKLESTDGSTALSVGGDTGDLVALLNFQADTSELDSANIDGAANGAYDGTVTTSGGTITVQDTSNAEGLRLFYSGSGSESGITINLTIGLAATLSHTIDTFADTVSGAIETEIDNLEGQNDLANERISDMEERLARERESLLQRFIAMETAVTSMNRILETIRQQYAAISGNDN